MGTSSFMTAAFVLDLTNWNLLKVASQSLIGIMDSFTDFDV